MASNTDVFTELLDENGQNTRLFTNCKECKHAIARDKLFYIKCKYYCLPGCVKLSAQVNTYIYLK